MRRWTVLLVPLAAACAQPVAANLDDDNANRVVVALDQAGIAASKEPDPGTEGKERVLVPHGDVPRALGILTDQELPRRKGESGVPTGGESLVPSEAEERAHLEAAIAGEIERSLLSVRGIQDAHVHVSVPVADPLAREPSTLRPTASVLIRYGGAAPPMSVEDVQRLVAGGVSGMLPANVAVVELARTTAVGGAAATPLARLGPLAVATGSVRALEASLAVLLALVAILGGVTLFLFARYRAIRAEVESGRQTP